MVILFSGERYAKLGGPIVISSGINYRIPRNWYLSYAKKEKVKTL
jgi:hypothetical protein